MRVLRSTGSVELRRTPGCLWAFGLWFVAGGALCLGMVAFHAQGLAPWERAVAALIGGGVLAGGLFHLATTPATSLRFDLVRRRIRYERRAPLRRRVIVDVPITDFTGYSFARSTDSDGDPWLELAVVFVGRKPLVLDSASGHDRERLQRIANVISEWGGSGSG